MGVPSDHCASCASVYRTSVGASASPERTSTDSSRSEFSTVRRPSSPTVKALGNVRSATAEVSIEREPTRWGFRSAGIRSTPTVIVRSSSGTAEASSSVSPSVSPDPESSERPSPASSASSTVGASPGSAWQPDSTRPQAVATDATTTTDDGRRRDLLNCFTWRRLLMVRTVEGLSYLLRAFMRDRARARSLAPRMTLRTRMLSGVTSTHSS